MKNTSCRRKINRTLWTMFRTLRRTSLHLMSPFWSAVSTLLQKLLPEVGQLFVVTSIFVIGEGTAGHVVGSAALSDGKVPPKPVAYKLCRESLVPIVLNLSVKWSVTKANRLFVCCRLKSTDPWIQLCKSNTKLQCHYTSTNLEKKKRGSLIAIWLIH